MFSEDSVRDQGERHGKVKLLTAVKGSSVLFFLDLPINFNQVPVDCVEINLSIGMRY